MAHLLDHQVVVLNCIWYRLIIPSEKLFPLLVEEVQIEMIPVTFLQLQSNSITQVLLS